MNFYQPQHSFQDLNSLHYLTKQNKFTHAHRHVHTDTRTHKHTRIHTHTHTHTHTHRKTKGTRIMQVAIDVSTVPVLT